MLTLKFIGGPSAEMVMGIPQWRGAVWTTTVQRTVETEEGELVIEVTDHVYELLCGVGREYWMLYRGVKE